MAVIAHVDLDSFFVAVARLDDPSLAGRPVAVGSRVVASASYEARDRGVHSAMTITSAKELCPRLVVVGVDLDRCRAVAASVFDLVAEEFEGCALERVSIDEAFLDLSAVCDSPEQARPRLEQLRSAVLEHVGVVLSAGVGSSKTVAKVASGDAKPDGCVVVDFGSEAGFLSPLGVGVLWGVGPRTSSELESVGICTVGDLRLAETGLVEAVVGTRLAHLLAEAAEGRDDSAVTPERRRLSVGAQTALGAPSSSMLRVCAEIDSLCVELARRAADAEHPGSLELRLRRSDWSSWVSRRGPWGRHEPSAGRIALAARSLLSDLDGVLAAGVTGVGVALSGWEEGSRMGMFGIEELRPAAGALALSPDEVAGLDALGRLAPGMRVRHATFGDGHVLGVSDGALEVSFSGHVRFLDPQIAVLEQVL